MAKVRITLDIEIADHPPSAYRLPLTTKQFKQLAADVASLFENDPLDEMEDADGVIKSVTFIRAVVKEK